MCEQQPGCGPPAPVPILQHEAEFSVLLELYRRLAPADVLEVGTFYGGTLYHWLQNTARPGAKIVTVDSYAVSVDNRHLYDAWNVNDTRLIVLDADSHDPNTVLAAEANGPYDFVFIDAGHYYKEVKRDWENYHPMVKPGGMICLHDILTHPAWPSIEVGRLWEEIKKDHLTFEIVADRDAEWGGIGVVML
jgi:predicted O-methyltransferase YrrM